jgi:hypothetical protein
MHEALRLDESVLLSLALHVQSRHLLPLFSTRQKRITLTIYA